MTAEVENLILEHLKRIQLRLDRSEQEMVDTKVRVNAVEDHLAGLMTSMSGINHRLDRMDDRMKPIEGRLELVDSK